ncbi:MAG: DUF2069 domain-containing protein [Steroidobacteraceae bacterium]
MSPALLSRAAWLVAILTNSAWHLASQPTAAEGLLLAVTGGPMLLPLPGLWALRRRTLGWAPLTLSPAMTIALTELIANPEERWIAAAAAFSCFLALAGVVAALRRAPRPDRDPGPGGPGAQ